MSKQLSQEELVAKIHFHRNMQRSLNRTMSNVLENLERQKVPYATNPEYLMLQAEHDEHFEKANALQEQLTALQTEQRLAPVEVNRIALETGLKAVHAHLKTFKNAKFVDLPVWFEELDSLLNQNTGDVAKLKSAYAYPDLVDTYGTARQWYLKNKVKTIDPTKIIQTTGE